MRDWPLALTLAGDEATEAFGAALAGLLRVGDVVGLSGEIGAGKTTLARSIIRCLAGADIEVPSPTFTLVQTYPDLAVPIAHFDLYRVRHEDELAELGFAEASETNAVLVEWPEYAGSAMNTGALSIHLAIADDRRRAMIGGGKDWQARVLALPDAWR